MGSSVNTITDGGRVRRPRGIVKINGTAMPGWIEWEVQNNNNYQADTFRVAFALSQLPPEFGAAWWASQTSITVEIFAGFPADPENFSDSQLPPSWIYGNVDEVEYDPVGTVITLSGRDLTALFIDTKTTEAWKDKPSSEIAMLLAMRHYLTPVIQATGTEAGHFYEIEHVQMNHERSEWDLLTYLAAKEEFVVYVKGWELHFEPKPDPTSVKPYLLQWEDQPDSASPRFNGKTISFSRNLTIAKGIVVEIRSWNAKKKKGFTAFWPKSAHGIKAGAATSRGNVQNYVFIRAGLDQQAADMFAQNKHRELTRHEMRLRATMPADDLLTPNSVIQAAGTGGLFDQMYFAESVTRRMSVSEGYTMTVNAKNHNTDSETLA